MNLGFEITKQDIENVLNSYGEKVNKKELEDISINIDDELVAREALFVDFDCEMSEEDILEKQTDAAYDEIARQLYCNGVLTKEAISKYGNISIICNEE